MADPSDTPIDASSRDGAPAPANDTIKATLMSLVIAFVLTLVVRAFVVEAFVIPTGSMAPTLNGRHMRFRSPQTGADWAVNPWRGHRTDGESFVDALDPSSRLTLQMRTNDVVPGDRILVLKFLGAIFRPSRWDVVVFKNPERPGENYIKRLVGLPNEQVWIADGDVFVREPRSRDEARATWRIARKPQRVQRDLWWTLFSSEFTPIDAEHAGVPWRGPWLPDAGGDWSMHGAAMRIGSASPGLLTWDNARWPIDDWIPYNDAPDVRTRAPRFPVSDLRVRAAVRPDAPGLEVAASILARGHEFRAEVTEQSVRIRVRPVAGIARETEWTTLAEAAPPSRTLEPDRATSIEFRHVDQSASVWINGRQIARGEYHWGPWERLAHATGSTVEALEERLGDARDAFLLDGGEYVKPVVVWRFAGAAATLTRVGLDRDLHYEPSEYLGSALPMGPALATHPGNLPLLNGRQYFVLGDNSASSKDGRLWDMVDPWVADEIDGTMGVLPERLLLGKAFFVYFPAPHEVRIGSTLHRVVPDFGRMRLIR